MVTPPPAAAAVPREPYYVSFVHEIPLRPDGSGYAVDHSRSAPGPGPSASARAGYTSAEQNARLTFVWDDGPSRPDGRVAFYAQSVNVSFRLEDFVVAVSSDYFAGSCAYRATLRHELAEHVFDPIRTFHSYRNVLINRLNAIPIPTRRTPQWLRPAEIPAWQGAVERRVAQTVGALKRELVQALRSNSLRADAPASYRLVYAQCSDDEWLRGSRRAR